jgi:hypothetical protein
MQTLGDDVHHLVVHVVGENEDARGWDFGG